MTFQERYIAIILRRRWQVVMLAALVMVVMASGGRFIGVTNDFRSLFDKDDPQLAVLEAFEETYSVSRTALIAIAPRNGSVFTRETLGAIEALTEAAWSVPYSNRVESLTNYYHSEAFGDDLIVAPLVEDARSLSDADLARTREIALNATEIAGRLVARDGHAAGLAINIILGENSDAAEVEVTDYLYAFLDRARASYPDIAFYLTGTAVGNSVVADATKDDLGNLVPLVFLLIVVMTVALLRSGFATLAIVLTLLFTLAASMGFAGWIGTVFTPINSVVPTIVLTIAVADSIHIVTSALAGIRRGLGRNEAIAQSLRGNAAPVFITTVTTAIAFLSMNASEAPPIRDMGNLVALGVICAWAYSMTLLPAMLSLLPLRARAVRTPRLPFFERLAGYVIERRTVLLGFGALLTVVMAAGILRIEWTDNWSRMFDDRYEIRRDSDFVIENLTGLESLEYSLNAGYEGGIADPDYLRKVDAFAEWFRQQPEVHHVLAFSDFMKRLNKNLHGDDPAFYRLPEARDLAAQYLLLYELSLPFGSDLNNLIDIAKSATRMSVVVGNLSAQQQRELDARAQVWLHAHAPDLANPATGVTIVFAHLSQRNMASMLRSTMLAMGLISLILIWVLRSLRLGLISLVPNFVPAAISFGLWGYLVGHVGLAGSMTTAIAFGLIVDDTIHFLSHYRKARLDGLPATEAVRSTFGAVGPALWTTTLVLAAGFLVFTASGFQATWALGMMVTITILVAIAADFLLLPTLLAAIDRKKVLKRTGTCWGR